MARIPLATPESVPTDQREALDEYVRQRGAIPHQGPLSIMAHVPELLKRGEHFRAYIRGETSSLALKTRELAMLLTAREMDCQFIWYAHAAAGRRAGLRDDLVDNLRDKKVLTDLAADELAVVNYGREFFRTHRVSQVTFDAVVAEFGVRGAVELSALMGYYAMLAFTINAFEAIPPADGPEPLLPIDPP